MTRYYTGKPCKRGHICERYIKSRVCVQCMEENNVRWKEENREQYLTTRRNYHANNHEKILEQAKILYYKNPGKFGDYVRKQRAKDPEKYKEKQRIWREENPDKMLAAVYNWRKNNYDRVLSINRLYDQRVRIATPSWVDKQEMYSIYQNCPDGYHVDHVIPLKGITPDGYRVSGLNVPWNLQYLTVTENLSKGNKMNV